jgi:hypothetical protein
MPIFKKRLTKKIYCAAAALICLSPVMLPTWGNGGNDGGGVYAPYITLITGEDTADRLTAEKLSDAGIKNVLSESSQWFFLNDFSELRRVPLDEFSSVMLESDPRNDGYAQKLKSIFARDGNRYFYIPAASFNSPFPAAPAAIEQRIKNALKDVRHSVVFTTTPSQGANVIPLYAAAAFLSLAAAFCISKPDRPRSRARFTLSTAALLPSCGLLIGQGSAGFTLSALMLVLFLTLQTPFEDFFTRFWFDRKFSASQTMPIKQFLQKEKNILIFLFVLILAVCIAGKIHYVFLAFLFFCLSVSARVFAECAGRRDHIVFVPIRIRPCHVEKGLLAAFPFTLAGAAALLLPLFYQSPQAAFPAASKASKNGLPVIAAADYEAHINFQKNFAITRLIRAENGAEPAGGVYMNFEQDGGGLFRPAAENKPPVSEIEKTTADIPSFPLENLIAFLNDEQAGSFVQQGFDLRALLAVLAALTLYIPGLVYAAAGDRKKSRNTLYMSQSVTA